MDFPKSMPDIGLVNGQFVDENITTGQAGTYIPSSWGNAVTHEVLNVIEAAGLTPDEGDYTQLMVAVNRLSSRYAPVLRYISESHTFTSSDLGLALINASQTTLTITLPSSNSALGVRDVIVHRVDSTGNRLKVVAAENDTIKLHTHLNASGYPFLILMGAGDWWHLRSDGAGNWWPVGRSDATPLGRVVLDTSKGFPPGGYGAVSGSIFVRSEWPWLWDYAQQSGMLTTDAQRSALYGCWTTGDGTLTFRGPEMRGEFLRVFDESRGLDASRIAGSHQDDAFRSHTHVNFIAGQKSGASSPGADSAVYGGGYVTGATGGTETRPHNIAYPGRIKLI
ncbi:phage tail protein [Pseudomonas syringae]|nr:phage tail protein [Pseudomonas syringae]